LWSLFFAIQPGVLAIQFDIQGTVVDADGAPISQATLYLSEVIWTISDDDGSFLLENVPNGDYELTVSRVGFESEKIDVVIPFTEIEPFTITLKEKVYNNNPVIVTADRSSKLLEDVSVPVEVINQAEIRSSGSLRLSDILDEQIGLNVVSDHGTGIQVQGFDPEYTLILIDNQPLIGRTAGTLDLTRLAVGNIEQIEIVKGPSSALWGSNALAGVINIITEKGNDPFNLDISTRYGSFETMDLGVNGTFKIDNLRGRFFGNYNGSDGYDLNTSTVAPTIPEYDNLTLSGGVNYRISRNVDLGISTRYYSEDQYYNDEINNRFTVDPVTGENYQTDFSITPEIKINLGNRFLLVTNAFLSSFESNSTSIFSETGEVYFSDDFEQTLNRFETQGSAYWNKDHTTVVGAGMNREDLTAEIYADVPFFDSYFGFGQHEWWLNEKLSLTGGFRYDIHSEYESQFSPKFSSLYKASDKLQIRASLGGGYKAPDFRQLFLNFTNPVAGYSVFGSSTVVEGINRLDQDGQLVEIFFDPTNIGEIKAERSFAFNTGFDWSASGELKFTFNAFRNNVQNLIETQRIALKTNGQSVFSYFNFKRVFTQGLETEIKYSPTAIKGFNLSIGYQMLDAQREITRTFDRVVDGVLVTVSEDTYIPLFNRSRHSFNLKLFQYVERFDLETSLRFNVRGKYWFTDFNENGRDETNEYVLVANTIDDVLNKTIVNYTLSKTFYERYQLQVGINNLFNFQDELVLPSNPGRTFFTQLNIKLY
jgi:outer membrane receptor for ferrienterochelin and colicins